MSDISESVRAVSLSVGLIVPDATRCRSLEAALGRSTARVARLFERYPSRTETGQIGHQQHFDVVIVDLNQDVELSLRVIENLCSQQPSLTVMAYSNRNDLTLMHRSMQSGAREFLIEPLLAETVNEAFARASSRRLGTEKAAGKMMVFVPTKGGVGVTTLAANFAVALTRESGARVVIVDMDFQLGDIALGLGVTPAFSVMDALMNAHRLDREFLSTLLVRHTSGLEVLGSPEGYTFFQSPVDEGADKLFRILREEFDYVVVDTGTCRGHIQESLFGMADKLYVITEMNLPSLRNGHRLISYLSGQDGIGQMEIVLNRFNSRHGDIDESSATKALARPINWRVPNGYAAARTAQDSGVPLAMADSPITRVFVEMAKAACGKPAGAQKRPGKGFSFFSARPLPATVET